MGPLQSVIPSELVSAAGGCFDRDARIPRRAPHAPIPDERAARDSAHPPALGCSFCGGYAPTPPPDQRTRRGLRGRTEPPMAPGSERVGVRARRGVGRSGCEPGRVRARMREQGPQASARGRGGRSPPQRRKSPARGQWEPRRSALVRGRVSTRAARAREPSPVQLPRGGVGAQPPTEKRNPGRVGGGAARSARSSDAHAVTQPARAREPSPAQRARGAWGAQPPTEK